MIEQLKNCPNCGGTLNEAGRCSFCGSKIFDFLSINFEHDHSPSAKTYIRIKTNGKIIIAPVIVESACITIKHDDVSFSSAGGNRYYAETTIWPAFDVTFLGVGDMVEIDDKGGAE